MKPGAKKREQVQIYRLMQQGFSAAQISSQIKVYKSCVEGFMKHFEDPKNVPRTSGFAEVKDGMPAAAGQGRNLQSELANSQAENSALASRMAALEAKFDGLTTPTEIGDDDDGLG